MLLLALLAFSHVEAISVWWRYFWEGKERPYLAAGDDVYVWDKKWALFRFTEVWHRLLVTAYFLYCVLPLYYLTWTRKRKILIRKMLATTWHFVSKWLYFLLWYRILLIGTIFNSQKIWKLLIRLSIFAKT